MKYDFDKIIERRGTNSLKWDFAVERGMPGDLLPMWVADMDFPAPPEVLEDISKTVSHGIFGYTEPKEAYYDALTSWFSERYGFEFSAKDVVKTPGVVFALAMCIRAFTEPGDAIIVQTPVYYPFFEIIKSSGRRLVTSSLLYSEGDYTIDFNAFEERLVADGVKLFLLSNPHNPVGRVWTKDELLRLHDICTRHGVQVISDEIHCDFVFAPHEHNCFGLIDEDAIVATAPSKTFNLAGLQVSNIIAKNATLRRRLVSAINSCGYEELNTVGLTACCSAYTKGGPWLAAVKEYILGNIRYAESFLADKLPNVRLVPTQGTYLLWMDFSAYGLSHENLDRIIVTDAKLWLDTGTMFGPEGAGFQRMNAACPRQTMETALTRLAAAFGYCSDPTPSS